MYAYSSFLMNSSKIPFSFNLSIYTKRLPSIELTAISNTSYSATIESNKHHPKKCIRSFILGLTPLKLVYSLTLSFDALQVVSSMVCISRHFNGKQHQLHSMDLQTVNGLSHNTAIFDLLLICKKAEVFFFLSTSSNHKHLSPH